jgi:hypothetical protein
MSLERVSDKRLMLYRGKDYATGSVCPECLADITAVIAVPYHPDDEEPLDTVVISATTRMRVEPCGHVFERATVQSIMPAPLDQSAAQVIAKWLRIHGSGYDPAVDLVNELLYRGFRIIRVPNE